MEPSAEFVEIDLSSTDNIPSDCDQSTSKRASVETCTGPDAPFNAYCPPDEFMFRQSS